MDHTDHQMDHSPSPRTLPNKASWHDLTAKLIGRLLNSGCADIGEEEGVEGVEGGALL